MQPVRVYKVSCLLLQVGVLDLAGFMYILRAGFFLGKNQVGEYRGPICHSFVREASAIVLRRKCSSARCAVSYTRGPDSVISAAQSAAKGSIF
jgi:hypothetical protein